MTDKQQPEDLKLAEELDAVPETGADPQMIEDAATELRRQHARIADLEAQLAAIGAPAAIEAQEPLFLLYTGEARDGEQDDWDVEPDSQAAVDDYCAANPGKVVGLFPYPLC